MEASRRAMLKLAGLGVAAPAAMWAQQGKAQAAAAGVVLPQPPMPEEKSDTARLQRAFDKAHAQGGGTVYLAAGRYISGSLQLRSNVSLWLENGAVLAMSPDDGEFLPVEKLPYDPGSNQATADFHVALLIGDGVESIAIFGEGTIECERGAKRGGPKPIALRRCTRVSLRGFTIQNAQHYNISMLGCEFVEIDGVTIRNGRSDGIDPDCCKYVRISNCFIESVDDSLCLKASGALGVRGATEYVTVTNCVLRTASIHFKCGTESCGDFRNIAISNCVFEGGVGLRHGNPGVAFYTVDEGSIEGIVVDGISMRNVATPIALIRGDRDRCALGKGPGRLRSVRISNIVATGAKFTNVIAGMPGYPIEELELSGITITMDMARAGRASLAEVPEAPKAYPAPIMFGEMPAHGLFLRHVAGARIRDVRITAPAEEIRPDLVADDVSGLRVRGYEKLGRVDVPHFWLNDVRDAYLECFSSVDAPAHAFRVTGAKTRDVFLRAEGRLDWKRCLEVLEEVPRNAVVAR